jgi:AmmeMemoRadiSam system protein B
MTRDRDEVAIPRLRPVEARQVEVSGRRMVVLEDPSGFSPEPFALAPDQFFVACHFDGRNSTRDVQAAYMRQFGELLFSEKIQELVDRMDDRLLLESPRFKDLATRDQEAFSKASVRPAVCPGGGYPADPADLRATLGSILSEEPAGEDIPEFDPAALEGAVLPHIDLARGAPVYGPAYSTLSTLDRLQTFVILGTAHAGLAGSIAVTRKVFETPLGETTTDQVFVDGLVDQLGPEILADEYAHKREHSIEIQVVFLQYLFGHEGPVRIVPILCGAPACAGGTSSGEGAGDMEEVAEALRRTRQSSGGGSVVLASADLAHLGPQFGDRHAVDSGTLATCEREDRVLLQTMSEGDAEGFLRAVFEDGNRRRICGFGSIYLLLKTIGTAAGTLLRYHQAIDGRGLCMVSFAGMVFNRGS